MNLKQENRNIDFLLKMAHVVGLSAVGIMLLLGMVVFLLISAPTLTFLSDTDNPPTQSSAPKIISSPPAANRWRAPELAALPATPEGDQIRYGRELVAHTAQYLGPQGSVRQISNGMNCQNCHLEAGTKLFGNNYALVATTYPKFRARSGTEEDVVKRVNDCFERSLNGKALERDSKEMEALAAYINWVGKEVPKGEKVKGSGLIDLPLLDRAASPAKGKVVYAQKCQSCHGVEGKGMKDPSGKEYQFPPLWGKNSYNNGAGLYRLSNFARYVKANMPLGATYDRPQLTDEEAWDLAAYVNSRPRPSKDLSHDWPNMVTKPFDHPFGPFADTYSEEQHKFGPFKPIIAAKK